MMKLPWPRLLLISLSCFALQTYVAMAQTSQDQAVESAIRVLDEIMAVPAKQIPQALLADASGVAIIPNVVKGGFVVGLRHGRGVILVRDDAGRWHPPMFASLTGGSVGWQAGLQSTDVVLVFKTRRSVNGLMNGKLTIGVDAAAAAGPVGRQAAAATDARLRAEILSYSRSRGLFAGVSIDGSVLQLDHLAGAGYYHRPIIAANGEAVNPMDRLPSSAVRLMNRLAHYTGAPQMAATAAPGAAPGVNNATSVVSQSELVRRQLASSWQRLSRLLDDRWSAYLEPPHEVLLSGQAPRIESLRENLQRYSAISADQRYAVLTRVPEFVATHRLLQEYINLQTKRIDTKLTLPPPPTSSAASPNPRY
ncbi:MAG TPA: lipid-binding SYLF domain-containing protein [Pirellulaceae bacterium]|nr:lipid-binding SYLF domain-containing protein [Pirellulaceae bacterium]